MLGLIGIICDLNNMRALLTKEYMTLHEMGDWWLKYRFLLESMVKR